MTERHEAQHVGIDEVGDAWVSVSAVEEVLRRHVHTRRASLNWRLFVELRGLLAQARADRDAPSSGQRSRSM